MSDYIDDAIESGELTSSYVHMENDMYRATLKSPRGELVRKIRMKPGSPQGPDTGQLVYYLATTMQIVEDCEDYLEWAKELGREPADGVALNEYRDLITELDEFKLVLGMDTFQSLLAALSIDQAISNAASSLPRTGK